MPAKKSVIKNLPAQDSIHKAHSDAKKWMIENKRQKAVKKGLKPFAQDKTKVPIKKKPVYPAPKPIYKQGSKKSV